MRVFLILVCHELLQKFSSQHMLVLHQVQKLPTVETDYIGSALWKQVISSPTRTVIAKLIIAPR